MVLGLFSKISNYYVVNSDTLCCHIIIKYNAHVCFCDGLMEYKNKGNEREFCLYFYLKDQNKS